MKDRYIATVDLGSSKIALSVARVVGADVQVLYYRETPSDGVRRGSIFNPEKASIAVRAAVSAAEEELGVKIRQVVIGLPRCGIRQEIATASTERSDAYSCISQDEIDAVKNMALDTYPLDNEEEEEMYGAVAQSFSTEDAYHYSEADVVGMPSRSLEGEFKVFVGKKKAVRNIDIMLEKAGVAEAAKYFLPISTADAVLTPEEKENGVALIEIGAGVTSLTICQDGIMRYYCAIPFGGRNITADIKYECGFTEVLAENIKMAFGACMPERLQNMSEKTLQIRDEADGSSRQVTVKYLSEVITARVKEIVDAILFKIQESGYADKLRNGIVLTGGGANLVNCGNLIKQMSGYNVRIGYPRARHITVSGCAGISETSAAASVGMLMLASADTHIDCASEKKGGSATSGRKAASTADKAQPEPARETLFGEDEIEVVNPPKKDGKAPRKPKENGIFKWTKKKLDEMIGDLYDGMEQ